MPETEKSHVHPNMGFESLKGIYLDDLVFNRNSSSRAARRHV